MSGFPAAFLDEDGVFLKSLSLLRISGIFGDIEILCSYLLISSRNSTECLLFARHWGSHTVENKLEIVLLALPLKFMVSLCIICFLIE